MTIPTETETIPADVRKAAREQYMVIARAGVADFDLAIARAILAERSRCATVAETHTNASGLYIASMIREGAP